MSNPTTTVGTIPADLSAPPTGAVCHKRAVVTGAAANLDTFISGGYPAGTAGSVGPSAVLLQTEAASAANTVYVTFDGSSVPSATLGFAVPVAPSFLRIPFRAGFKPSSTTPIKAFASAGTVNVQCYFEFNLAQ